MSIGSRIKERREQLGMTQRQLADKLGVTPRAYYSYECGDRDPSTLSLAKMAIFFGVSADYLETCTKHLDSSRNLC